MSINCENTNPFVAFLCVCATVLWKMVHFKRPLLGLLNAHSDYVCALEFIYVSHCFIFWSSVFAHTSLYWAMNSSRWTNSHSLHNFFVSMKKKWKSSFYLAEWLNGSPFCPNCRAHAKWMWLLFDAEERFLSHLIFFSLIGFVANSTTTTTATTTIRFLTNSHFVKTSIILSMLPLVETANSRIPKSAKHEF